MRAGVIKIKPSNAKCSVKVEVKGAKGGPYEVGFSPSDQGVSIEDSGGTALTFDEVRKNDKGGPMEGLVVNGDLVDFAKEQVDKHTAYEVIDDE